MSRATAADRIFGQKVGEARRSRGVTQADLAVATGVGAQQTILKIEKGYRKATIGEAQSIAVALGMPLADLLDGGYQEPAECPGCIRTRQKVLAIFGGVE